MDGCRMIGWLFNYLVEYLIEWMDGWTDGWTDGQAVEWLGRTVAPYGMDGVMNPFFCGRID